MVGSHHSLAAAVQRKRIQLELLVEVDVIQVQQGQETRVCFRSAQMRSEVAALEMGLKHPRRQPFGPLVEIAEDDLRPMQMVVSHDLAFKELACLLPALEIGRSKVHVEHMQQRPMVQAHVGAQAAAPFTSLDGDIEVLSMVNRKTREHKIPVSSSFVLPVFAEFRVIAGSTK